MGGIDSDLGPWDAQRALDDALAVLREVAEKTGCDPAAQAEARGTEAHAVQRPSRTASKRKQDEARSADRSAAHRADRGVDHRAPDRRSIPLVDGRSASAMFARMRLEWDLELEHETVDGGDSASRSSR